MRAWCARAITVYVENGAHWSVSNQVGNKNKVKDFASMPLVIKVTWGIKLTFNIHRATKLSLCSISKKGICFLHLI